MVHGTQYGTHRAVNRPGMQWVCLSLGLGLGVRVPGQASFTIINLYFLTFGLYYSQNFEKILWGFVQKFERNGGFAWRRERVLPPPRDGSAGLHKNASLPL